VFGAFSGTIPLPVAEVEALGRECRQWRRTTGDIRSYFGAAKTADEGDDRDGAADGEPIEPR
jgi:hypothetical protein